MYSVMKKVKIRSIYFCWEAKAKASCFFRETPNFSATFSEVILGKTTSEK